MTDDERERWDQRYADGEYVPRASATPLLLDWLDRFPSRGRALDIATGTGRNALALAAAGYTVDAIDISEVAIRRARDEAGARGLDVDWQVADLDTVVLAPGAYDLITVLRYRNPDLWPRLLSALAPGGWLVVEHHLKTHLEVGGPPSDAFRLDPGELLEAFGDLRIVHYSEAVEDADDRPDARYVLARLVACHGDPGW